MVDPTNPAAGASLHGLRILDLTANLAGPFCTMLLRDLGADVVKVEPPGGDPARAVGPFHIAEGGDKGLGGYFQSVNRGKQSVVIDLKDDADRSRFLLMVDRADVLVENYSVGVMDRLGLGYEVLHERNPKLVYAAIRGFGDPRSGSSPYVDWPAFDIIAQAMSGFASITGTLEGEPVKSGPGIGDIFPGVLLAVGVLAAVRHAERSGEGQFLDVGMYDALLAMSERIVHSYSYTSVVPKPQGNTHPLLCPFDIFTATDGWVAIAAPSDHHWRTLCTLIDRIDLGNDPTLAHNADRAAAPTVVRAAIEAWTSTRRVGEVVATLSGKVPVGPVNDARAIFADPHVQARDMIATVPETNDTDDVKVAGLPIKLTGTPGRVWGRAPLLGEHSAADVTARWSGASPSAQ